MLIILLSLSIAAILLYHFFIWEPLDTSVLYKNHRYLLFGHRGTPVHEPENTIVSFKKAVSDGCNAIELDVHRTIDGHLVVFHDDTLERTTDGRGRVSEKTLAELRKLNAADKWEGRTELIPTLKEVIEAMPANIIFNFEIKNFSFFSEQRTELELVRFIHANHLRDRVIISSFNPLNIWRVKMADPSIFTALLWYMPSLLSLRHPLGVHLSHPDIFHPFESDVNWGVRFWSRIKKIPMHVWVVNDERQIRLFAKDPMIKGIMSDNSELLISSLPDKLDT
jgi:glycerophosphoryl diester phosphodiesterase